MPTETTVDCPHHNRWGSYEPGGPYTCKDCGAIIPSRPVETQTTIHAGLAAGYHCAATAGESLSCFWPDCECVSDDEIKEMLLREKAATNE